MTERAIFRAILGVFLALAAFSCKKDDGAPPDNNSTRIIGSWREAYRAADSNSNGRADSDERSNSTQYRVVTFYTNGSVRDTAFINGVASSIEATYTIDGDMLGIVFPGIPASKITRLDADSLVLSDTTSRPHLLTGYFKL